MSYLLNTRIVRISRSIRLARSLASFGVIVDTSNAIDVGISGTNVKTGASGEANSHERLDKREHLCYNECTSVNEGTYARF